MSGARVFVSYSRDDQRWFEPGSRYNLIPWLQESLRRDEVTLWYDRSLEPGERFRERIEEEIERAEIALLLVSQAFLSSEFIETVELPRIQQREARGELVVIPILVGPCDWEDVHFIGMRQMMPGKPTPLIDYTETEREWEHVRVEILRGIRSRIRSLRQPPPDGPATAVEVPAPAAAAAPEPAPAQSANVAPVQAPAARPQSAERAQLATTPETAPPSASQPGQMVQLTTVEEQTYQFSEVKWTTDILPYWLAPGGFILGHGRAVLVVYPGRIARASFLWGPDAQGRLYSSPDPQVGYVILEETNGATMQGQWSPGRQFVCVSPDGRQETIAAGSVRHLDMGRPVRPASKAGRKPGGPWFELADIDGFRHVVADPQGSTAPFGLAVPSLTLSVGPFTAQLVLAEIQEASFTVRTTANVDAAQDADQTLVDVEAVTTAGGSVAGQVDVTKFAPQIRARDAGDHDFVVLLTHVTRIRALPEGPQ